MNIIREDFGKFLTERNLLNRGMELGVRDGEFALQILKHWKGKQLYLVDSWQQYKGMKNITTKQHIDNMRLTAERMIPHNDIFGRISMIRMPSVKASLIFPTHHLDWIYIDADHTTRSVFRDIYFWWHKVRPGGIVAGHDWQIDSVRQGVNEFLEEMGHKYVVNVTKPSLGTSWWIQK